MNVGNFGNMTFSVSKKKVKSFSNFKRSRTAEWKEHTRYGNKPVSEFVSPGLQSISFDIYLDVGLGVNPRKEIEKWGDICEKGKHDILVIGNEQIGKNEWKIESVSEEWNTIFCGGELIAAMLSITMSEYVELDANKKNTTKAMAQPTVTLKKAVKSKSASSVNVGSTYKVKTVLTGYYTAKEAKNLKATNRTGKVYPGQYYVFNKSDGMLNVTKVKGSPGSWINPGKNK